MKNSNSIKRIRLFSRNRIKCNNLFKILKIKYKMKNSKESNLENFNKYLILDIKCVHNNKRMIQVSIKKSYKILK
jgi:hypothetical protein